MEIFEHSKIEKEEWVGILTFSLAMLITLNFPISLFLTIIVSICFFIIKKVVIFFIGDSKEFFKSLSKWGKFFLIFWIVLFFIDTFLTWLAVHYIGFATEYNLFAVLLWGTFGYLVGELFRIILFICAIFYPLWIFNHAKEGERRIFVAFAFSLAGWLLYGYVVIHNFLVLLSYLC